MAVPEHGCRHLHGYPTGSSSWIRRGPKTSGRQVGGHFSEVFSLLTKNRLFSVTGRPGRFAAYLRDAALTSHGKAKAGIWA